MRPECVQNGCGVLPAQLRQVGSDALAEPDGGIVRPGGLVPPLGKGRVTLEETRQCGFLVGVGSSA
jgi:hypothetical protein